MPRFSFFRRSPQRFLHTAFLEGVLGTSLEVQIVSEKETSGRVAEEAILGEIDRLEAIFNAYNPASELRRWQETWEEDVPVSGELAQVLSEAEKWREVTQGAFNPAVEALSQLWKKHAQEKKAVEPEEVQQLAVQMDGALWTVNLERNTARRHTNLPVTLNSIAKGFIVDAACRVALNMEGVQEVLINIGGDIRHAGTKPLAIFIADPRGDAENAIPADRVQIWNGGIATSGNYRRGFEIEGRWYSHVLDPRSGYPVEQLVGVSVIASDTAQADVLATAFSVLAPSESLPLADSFDSVGVLLITAEGTRFSNAFWDAKRLV